jgi:uncharacterized membrane protein YebE (DUF533 family)
MTPIRIALLTATAFLATTTIASAEYRNTSSNRGYGSTNEIDARQAAQDRRIHEGVRSGQITRSEHQRLDAEQARIRELERQAKSDGYVSAAERARIRSAQSDAGRHIYQEKHDSQTRNNDGSRNHQGHTHHRRWWSWY